MKKGKSMRFISVGMVLLWLLTVPLLAGAVQSTGEAGIIIDKTSYVPGEQIRLQFKAPANWPGNAWIGIIPSNVSHGSESVNDQYDITYQYIEQRTSGVMVFTAPGVGQWDLRMHDTDSNGREIAFASFTVSDSMPAANDTDYQLRLEKTVFAPGEKIAVRFQASANWPGDAWIGIIPSNVSHGSEPVNDQYDITYQYIEQRTSGVMVFTAPEVGQWDLRMHDTDTNGREIATISFRVR
ncbi:hypothetical protein SOV_50270 [Sporomusa ovata DSM 2662]|uniref:Uncharacterized protein n=1 Tax=Sporomusa ovata TaxID=2378 RepID=A0A0U1L250_9FIRM|nr:hypothetical protein [Sporomusa ovata]EQB27400.1 hypothetical protein SOV_2c02960 [Sporomusa ovata DSM 2662]CQR73243.1 hypothetical protein SpAn4DRAFT_2475 [Sporomusa ovata]